MDGPFSRSRGTPNGPQTEVATYTLYTFHAVEVMQIVMQKNFQNTMISFYENLI